MLDGRRLAYELCMKNYPKGEITPFNFSSRLYLLRKSEKTDSGKEKDPSEEVASFQRNSQSDGGDVVLYAQLW